MRRVARDLARGGIFPPPPPPPPLSLSTHRCGGARTATYQRARVPSTHACLPAEYAGIGTLRYYAANAGMATALRRTARLYAADIFARHRGVLRAFTITLMVLYYRRVSRFLLNARYRVPDVDAYLRACFGVTRNSAAAAAPTAFSPTGAKNEGRLSLALLLVTLPSSPSRQPGPPSTIRWRRDLRSAMPRRLSSPFTCTTPLASASPAHYLFLLSHKTP